MNELSILSHLDILPRVLQQLFVFVDEVWLVLNVCLEVVHSSIECSPKRLWDTSCHID